jgi:hypothetical protein
MMLANHCPSGDIAVCRLLMLNALEIQSCGTGVDDPADQDTVELTSFVGAAGELTQLVMLKRITSPNNTFLFIHFPLNNKIN